MRKNKNPDLLTSLREAEEAYLNQEFDLSAQLYNELVKQNPHNPYLLINDGNSYYQMKSYGKAMSKYYKAKSILPRNKELNQNLKILNDAIELNQPALLSYSFLTCTESFTFLLIFNILFLLRHKITKNSMGRLFIIACFIIFSLIFGYTCWEQYAQKYAVVTSISTKAYSGDNEAYSELFELLDGQIVLATRKEENWSKIKTKNALGWVNNEMLEFL